MGGDLYSDLSHRIYLNIMSEHDTLLANPKLGTTPYQHLPQCCDCTLPDPAGRDDTGPNSYRHQFGLFHLSRAADHQIHRALGVVYGSARGEKLLSWIFVLGFIVALGTMTAIMAILLLAPESSLPLFESE